MRVDWEKYPKLAEIFEHRPRENVYWIELDSLVKEHAKHVASLWLGAAVGAMIGVGVRRSEVMSCAEDSVDAAEKSYREIQASR